MAGQWWDQAAPPVIHGQQMPVTWWEAAKRGATRHNTDPFRIAAVAWIECGGWKEGQLGRGVNGRKYIGPMGFNKDCRIQLEVIFTPTLQIEWAAGLLCGDLKRRLRRYNASWQENHYVRDVLQLAEHIEWQARQLCQK